MSDLTTSNLKRLLDQAAPGPWEYWLGEEPDERYIIDIETFGSMCIYITPNGAGSSCSDYDLNLAALAPGLAEEVLRMRLELSSMRHAWEDMSTNPARTPTEQNLAAHVLDHIDSILGETND